MHPSLILRGCLLAAWSLFAAGPGYSRELAEYVIQKVATNAPVSQTGFFTFCPWTSGPEPVFEVVTSDGSVVVPHQPLWSAEGEPTTVLFDCSSGHTKYVVRELAKARRSTSDWTPTGGVVLETRAFEGGPAASWKQIRRSCEKADPVLGRGLVTNVFLGVNPQGPTQRFVSVFRGSLNIETAGTYTFAVISDGASSLFIDDKHVVSRPGHHNLRGEGRRGKYREQVHLKKGARAFEYLNIQRGSSYSVALAWAPPGEEELQIAPPNAFVPAIEYRVLRSRAVTASTSPVRFGWKVESHLCAWGRYLVWVELRALSAGTRHTWTLDDGTVLEGPEVRHLFLSPGMRAVTLTVSNGRRSRSEQRQIMAHPNWSQLGPTEQGYWKHVHGILEERSFNACTAQDLLNVLGMASMADDHVVARRVADMCMEKLDGLGARSAEIAMQAGMYYKNVMVRDYTMAKQAFRSVIRLCGSNDELKVEAQLALADCILPVSDDFEEVEIILNGIDDAHLDAEERRRRTIYKGDLMLAMGKLEAARKKYTEAGEGPEASHVHDERKRVAMLEVARDYNRRGEYNAAERIVSRIQDAVPVERLNRDVGLVLLDTCLGRTDYTRAYYLSKRLLQNSEFDSNRPMLLYKLAESAHGTDADAEADAVVERLTKEFPYSEAAALARERWGKR